MAAEHVGTIRRADIGEAAAIRTFVREAYAKWVDLIGREPLPMTADYEAALREHLIDLYSSGDLVLGLIEMQPMDDHLYVVNVAVRPSAQGKGIGRLLLAHAEDEARRRGLVEMQLRTNAAFEANIELYRRLGYLEDKREPFSLGTRVFMSKQLQA